MKNKLRKKGNLKHSNYIFRCGFDYSKILTKDQFFKVWFN